MHVGAPQKVYKKLHVEYNDSNGFGMSSNNFITQYYKRNEC